ncbi:pectate lyase [Saccharothrix deserti]|uniref:pectate lyase n=1 Tax=Saccharothrix deserti TaxID=2593674 RepID=UPI001EE4BEE6|nr:pectate lyase [Saccharothrix deserti]
MHEKTKLPIRRLLSAAAAFAIAAVLTTAVAPSGSAAGSTFPSAKGTQPVSTKIKVGTTPYDGGMKRFYGTGALGDGGQEEGKSPLFELANGATLSNVILGYPASDGIHCLGTCTLNNVWWEDVGEDAATLKGSSSSQKMTVNGGGARKASDKVFQHNGPGTIHIRNFQVDDFGKLYRSCGNCGTQYKRHVILENVTAYSPGKVLAGINTNYGDTARYSGITIVGDSSRNIVICEKYKGVTSGEPTKIGSGADSTNCLYSSSNITYR